MTNTDKSGSVVNWDQRSSRSWSQNLSPTLFILLFV